MPETFTSCRGLKPAQSKEQGEYQHADPGLRECRNLPERKILSPGQVEELTVIVSAGRSRGCAGKSGQPPDEHDVVRADDGPAVSAMECRANRGTPRQRRYVIV